MSLLPNTPPGPRLSSVTLGSLLASVSQNGYSRIMKTLEIAVPDDLDLTAGATPEELAGLASMAFALRLFELGKITSGQAARIAGIPRRRFLLATPRHGIPSVSWDDEELAAEQAAILKPL